MRDFLFRGSLAQLDPDLYDLTQIEAERQYRVLILIPSESYVPLAIREALASAFHNIYAEGYPPEATRFMSEDEILDYKMRLAEYRRFSDPRYYKGVEYADIVEALARRRAAELFAATTPDYDPEEVYVNVQPLSGAPANNAVYTALLKPGDTILSMDLIYGGHLSHGSRANRTGKLYNVVHYTIDPQTGQIDYEQIEALAREHKPKIIIAGYSSYPWQVNWQWFRRIADEVGAYLMADISHVAGLVVAGAYPTPVGWAHIITTTTHKTLMGPRGALIITTEPTLARKIDRGVFPGEQGGPHVNVFAAMALAFKLARTQQFKDLQHQIVKNAAVLADRLAERGLRIAYGGTNTHLLNVDMKSVRGRDGTPLSGDLAARILDLAGIVVNRNTIPGDKSAKNPSGIRLGTPWITQRGFREDETRALADIIADLLLAVEPYRVQGAQRAKVDYAALRDAKLRVRDLALQAGIEVEPPAHHGYPHFYYADDKPQRGGEHTVLAVGGPRARQFLNFVLSADIEALQPGQSAATLVPVGPDAHLEAVVTAREPHRFHLTVPADQAAAVADYLRALSDGYIAFGDDDLRRKIPGPVWVHEDPDAEVVTDAPGPAVAAHKPYFIGISRYGAAEGPAKDDFHWEEPAAGELKRTPLHALHKQLGAKMGAFAGYEMPLWYSSAKDEHLAVRTAAGVFDIAHMGVFELSGPDAAAFLDSVLGNDIGKLAVGESAYSHLLDAHARVIDDVMVYRVGPEQFFLVVNAANVAKDWVWLHLVKDGRVQVDPERPWALAFGRGVRIRDLRDPQAGLDRRVLIAIQGPRSLDALLALGADEATKARLRGLKWAHITPAILGGFDIQILDVYVSRTGYTGERRGYELFVHPMQAATLMAALLQVGEPFGVKPAGLAARDSLRTEAGLPLYGHELGGPLNLGVGDAGLARYVKVYKPWFVGRAAFLEQEAQRTREVIRFKVTEKPSPMAHQGDPVLDRRGKVVGVVTSSAVGTDGYQVGLAYVDKKYKDEGTPLYLLTGAHRHTRAPKAPADLQPGDKVPVPVPAVVGKRFPKKFV